jgi:hypothetical protein
MPMMSLQLLHNRTAFPNRYWYFTGGSVKAETVPDALLETLVKEWEKFPADKTRGVVVFEQV